MSRNVFIAAAVSVAVHAALIFPLISHRTTVAVPAAGSSAAELIHVDVLTPPKSTPSPQKGEGARRAGGASHHDTAVLAEAGGASHHDTAVLETEVPTVEAAEQSGDPSPGAFAPPSPVGEGTSPPPALDPNVERELHQRLQSNAARCYPNASRRFHEQGVTEVSFCVGDSGQLAEAKLSRSSGSDRLDHAALDCVIGGSEPFPAAHGRCFALPVHFGD